jgi:hypothetical protein
MDRHKLALMIFVQQSTTLQPGHKRQAELPDEAYKLADLFLAKQAEEQAKEEKAE